MKKLLLLSLFALLCPGITFPNILNVPGSYTTIQAAINASSNGDTVLVQTGTYTENINFRGKKIVMTSRYYITQDPSTIWGTVINGSSPASPDSASCVIINNNEDSTTVLQGFAITGGGGTKWTDEHGAGLYREGGGILIQYSSPVIKNNIIYNNLITSITGVVSTGGGGMRIGDCYPRIYNNIIYGNTARYGAGIVLNYTGCDMRNNIICANYGSYQFGGGSGIWINSNFSRPKLIENNTIANNSATAGIGGISQSGTTTFRNNIIWGNSIGNQIQGPGAIVSYCDIQGGYTGPGNINVNPMFGDSSFILMSSSPCADSGDSSAAFNDPNSSGMALYPSRGTLRNDMGAYGGPGRTLMTNTIIGIKQINNEIPETFRLYQNYPNPFNPTTKIRFEVASSPLYERGVGGVVSLKIYDILGREVITLLNELLKPGLYEVNWNTENYPSGVYYYKLTTGDFSETKKMVLIR